MSFYVRAALLTLVPGASVNAELSLKASKYEQREFWARPLWRCHEAASSALSCDPGTSVKTVCCF